MATELGSVLEEAIKNSEKKTMTAAWSPMSEFIYNGQFQLMIASKDLIDPITNPEGVAVAYIYNGGDEFIVPVFEQHSNVPSVLRIDRADVTHFIEIKGPY